MHSTTRGQVVALIISPLKSQPIHTMIKGRWYKYEIFLTLDVLGLDHRAPGPLDLSG